MQRWLGSLDIAEPCGRGGGSGAHWHSTIGEGSELALQLEKGFLMVHLDMRPQVAGATAELGLTAAGAAIGVLEEARRDHLRQSK